MIDDITPMARSSVINVSRRALFRGTGALVLGLHLPALSALPAAAAGNSTFPINAWLRISFEAITVIVAASEMGQGVFTALPMLIAEELDADWRLVRAEMAPLDAVYANPVLGAMRTSGSTSVRAAFFPLRRAGAAARLMLMAAAARVWRVPLDQVTTEAGVVSHAATNRQASYGALAQLAARQKVPSDPPLRESRGWRLIGKSLPRLDTPAKVLGQAVFGIDVRVPGMVYAAIRHCPVLGGTLGRVDDSALRVRGVAGYRPGIMAVVSLRDAVAVVGDSWWQARAALARLAVAWVEGNGAELNSAESEESFGRALDPKDGRGITVAVSRGEADQAVKAAHLRLEAVYRLPFLAHAALEPMNATASVTGQGCTLWVPTQNQSRYAKILPELLGLKPDQITVNTPFIGGSFGRRQECDLGIEAALLSKAVGKPVQLIWTREEDIRRDFFRPASVSRVSVGLDAQGRLVGWHHRIVAPSVLARARPEALRDGLDVEAIAGVNDQPYALPALRLDYIRHEVGIPVGFWRSGGHGSNAFAVESMIDEVAAALGRDPYAYRRTLLIWAPRALRVLELAAEKADWTRPLVEKSGARRGRGIAFHEGFGSVAALVIEVTVYADGRLKVDRAVAAIDCGQVINPDIVTTQIEGAVVFGLTAALTGKITVERGRVVQSNFHDVPLLTLADTPHLQVHIIDSDGPPGGVGEAGVPPVAPALTNAIFAATGQRLRRLPVGDHDLRRV